MARLLPIQICMCILQRVLLRACSWAMLSDVLIYSSAVPDSTLPWDMRPTALYAACRTVAGVVSPEKSCVMGCSPWGGWPQCWRRPRSGLTGPAHVQHDRASPLQISPNLWVQLGQQRPGAPVQQCCHLNGHADPVCRWCAVLRSELSPKSWLHALVRQNLSTSVALLAPQLRVCLYPSGQTRIALAACH